jgi:hypothetical protein
VPPVASGHVTFRFWRPAVTGRHVVVVGFEQADVADFCRDYRLLARMQMPVDNEERGRPIAVCTLNNTLTAIWPRIIQLSNG